MAKIFQAVFKKSKDENENEKEKKNFQDAIGSETFSKLGIQGLPGTKFKIGGQDLYLGETGIFDLELQNNIQLSELFFYEESLDKIIKYNSYLIVDGIVE